MPEKQTEYLLRGGILRAYLIAPYWRGNFPYLWPKEKWPVIGSPLFEKHNQITKVGQIRSYTNGLNFTFIAGGTGNSTPTRNQTSLDNESQRFEVDDLIQNVAGQVDVFARIPPGTGAITWEEWGVFMDDAASTIDSGTMYSRILQAYSKNLGDDVLITYTLKESLVIA